MPRGSGDFFERKAFAVAVRQGISPHTQAVPIDEHAKSASTVPIVPWTVSLIRRRAPCLSRHEKIGSLPLIWAAVWSACRKSLFGEACPRIDALLFSRLCGYAVLRAFRTRPYALPMWSDQPTAVSHAPVPQAARPAGGQARSAA